METTPPNPMEEPAPQEGSTPAPEPAPPPAPAPPPPPAGPVGAQPLQPSPVAGTVPPGNPGKEPMMAGDQRQPGTGLPIQPGPAQSVSGPISAAGINISTLAIGCLGIVIVVVLIFLVISFLTHHL